MAERVDNMPKTAREKSETGIYHIMLRGIDKRNLFLEKSDYEKFIEYIVKAKEKTDFTVYAYCLMTNHVHMLLKTENEGIGNIIRRITVGYAQYHNIKNSRTGHLFQNRFKSEPVDTDEYFLTVLRYIHQNPLKAKMVKKIEDYKWSSYNAYVNKNNTLVATNFALNFFKDLNAFIDHALERNDDQCLEYTPRRRYTDEELEKAISSLVDIPGINNIEKKAKETILKNIKSTTGASNRQLARVLKIGRGTMDRI